MIFKTLIEAQTNYGNIASWEQSSIYVHQLSDGRKYFSVQVFDTWDNSRKCKKCRKARLRHCATDKRRKERPALKSDAVFSEIASTGHTCDRCGNPFCSKVRSYKNSCLDGGKLH